MRSFFIRVAVGKIPEGSFVQDLELLKSALFEACSRMKPERLSEASQKRSCGCEGS